MQCSSGRSRIKPQTLFVPMILLVVAREYPYLFLSELHCPKVMGSHDIKFCWCIEALLISLMKYDMVDKEPSKSTAFRHGPHIPNVLRSELLTIIKVLWRKARNGRVHSVLGVEHIHLHVQKITVKKIDEIINGNPSKPIDIKGGKTHMMNSQCLGIFPRLLSARLVRLKRETCVRNNNKKKNKEQTR